LKQELGRRAGGDFAPWRDAKVFDLAEVDKVGRHRRITFEALMEDKRKDDLQAELP